jgi:hypothetical protein
LLLVVVLFIIFKLFLLVFLINRLIDRLVERRGDRLGLGGLLLWGLGYNLGHLGFGYELLGIDVERLLLLEAALVLGVVRFIILLLFCNGLASDLWKLVFALVAADSRGLLLLLKLLLVFIRVAL